VRHVRGDPERVVAETTETELQQVGCARRDLHRLQPRLVVGRETRPGAVHGRRHRPGVRDSEGDGGQADGETHLLGRDEVGDGRAEALPHDIGLRTVQQQERPAVEVVQPIDSEHRIGVGLPVVRLQQHQRPPGSVVEEQVHVERRHPLRPEVLEQVLHGQPGRPAGVDEAGQGVQQDRASTVGGRRPGGRGWLVPRQQVQRVDHHMPTVGAR